MSNSNNSWRISWIINMIEVNERVKGGIVVGIVKATL